MLATKTAETDLYEPVKNFLTEQGYRVRAEVKDCDVAAEKSGELLVVELKKSFNLKLLYQALDRLSITEQVYIAIPRPAKANTADYKNMLTLVKKLELGLITVALDSPVKSVDVVLYPETRAAKRQNTLRKRSLLKEIQGRSMDLNTGGSNKRKINTAYRERAVKIACILACRGEKSGRELVKDYGCEKDTGLILRGNFYGWFEKVGKGIYGLSESGKQQIAADDKLVEYYVSIYRK